MDSAVAPSCRGGSRRALRRVALVPAGLEFLFADLRGPENGRRHHTEEMSRGQLVVRRGQPFSITLYFGNRAFQPDTDRLVFIAETGPRPKRELGTQTRISLSPPDSSGAWGVAWLPEGATSLGVSLAPPADAVIGRYTLKVEISGSSRVQSHRLGEFILLFNPWSPEDEVFLPSEPQRHEFLLRDHGLIYKGQENWITPSPWNFGQFEGDIVDICLDILDRNLSFLTEPALDCSRRGSGVYICRVVSAMINSNDDSGVLQGNWGEDYRDGVSPSEWNGSVAILRRWRAANGQPVKYGQCWVFAAVMCTVMRCLGVPTRVVTNFCSAHSGDRNLTVDVFYNDSAEMLPGESKDRIWNFHVWNECWMARRDLPSGYDGWQVLDPTPQQTSKGLFCCGPASVKAVKEGDVQLPYDTPFVFCEVSGDEVTWLQEAGEVKEILSHRTHSIGKSISTKMVDAAERQDITDDYKYPEGSLEERTVFLKAARLLMGGTGPAPAMFRLLQVTPGPEPPVRLKLSLPRLPKWGQAVALQLSVSRPRAALPDAGPLLLGLRFSAQAVLHVGGVQAALWKGRAALGLGPGEEKELPLILPYDNYKERLLEEKVIRLSCIARVELTGQKILAVRVISLDIPWLTVEVAGRAVVGQRLGVSIRFTNTQPEALTGCSLELEGSGLVEGLVSTVLGTLEPGSTTVVELAIFPLKAGPRQLQALLTSNEIKEIKGFEGISVAPDPTGGHPTSSP
ncbi:protein-glutamine gamma-glutamyltransferase Z [Tachyglossus aculeatus]|uniref:protein-glutamine gamma-glutamyltransferase Z n=1 Tax=Tachyglossus aculeatus TaxID=9261 RepID=UPI0018F36E7F|nr:protein-glutamine gamma-glutamyltransferase Z [Tachyglossus aculeatus]